MRELLKHSGRFKTFQSRLSVLTVTFNPVIGLFYICATPITISLKTNSYDVPPMLYAPEFAPLIQLHVFAGCFLIMYETIQLFWVWCWGNGLGFNMTTTVICKPRPQTPKMLDQWFTLWENTLQKNVYPNLAMKFASPTSWSNGLAL